MPYSWFDLDIAQASRVLSPFDALLIVLSFLWIGGWAVERLVHSLIDFPAFFVTWLTFWLAGVISFIIVMIANRRKITLIGFLRHCFPFESWSTKSARIDVIIYFAGKVTDKAFSWLEPLCTALVVALVTVPIALVYPFGIIDPSFKVQVVCAVLVFLVIEFANYLSHYMQHYVPVLWELHKVHHSATFLNPLTAKRGHPLSVVFDGIVRGLIAGIPVGLFKIIFGLGVTETLLLYASANKLGSMITLDTLKHSHFPVSFGWLEAVFISPRMHHIHHSSNARHWDKNLGVNLSIWDWIFHTGYKPGENEEIKLGFGTGEERDYESVSGAYIGPLLKQWYLIAGRQSSNATTLNRGSFGEGILWRKSVASSIVPEQRAVLTADK